MQTHLTCGENLHLQDAIFIIVVIAITSIVIINLNTISILFINCQEGTKLLFNLLYSIQYVIT